MGSALEADPKQETTEKDHHLEGEKVTTEECHPEEEATDKMRKEIGNGKEG